jgi:hypothetical protein
MLLDCFEEEHLEKCYVVFVKKVNLVFLYFDRNTFSPEGGLYVYLISNFNLLWKKVKSTHFRGTAFYFSEAKKNNKINTRKMAFTDDKLGGKNN